MVPHLAISKNAEDTSCKTRARKIWPMQSLLLVLLARSLVLQVGHGHDASSCQGGTVGKCDKHLLGLGQCVGGFLVCRIEKLQTRAPTVCRFSVLQTAIGLVCSLTAGFFTDLVVANRKQPWFAVCRLRPFAAARIVSGLRP